MWLRWHVIEAHRRFMFFIYSPFVHISLVLNNNCYVWLRVRVHVCCVVTRLLPSCLYTSKSLCRRCAIIAVYRLNKTFLRYALTYYHYYRYHYRKNKSLNNHIRVVESLSWKGPGRGARGRWWRGRDRGIRGMRTFMHVYVYVYVYKVYNICRMCVYICVSVCA